MSADAKVNADVTLKPGRSQVFLVAVAVVAGISIICSTALFALGKKDEGWGLLITALLLFIGDFIAWNKSQSDSDLEGAHPTALTLPDGTNLTTDSRLLRSPDGFHAISRVFEEAWLRKPLERPDGLVNTAGQVIQGSSADAAGIANEVNTKTQRLTNELFDAFGISEESVGRTQGAVSPTCHPPIPSTGEDTRQ